MYLPKETAACERLGEGISPSVRAEQQPRPFLKWAGGKRQLLQELVRRVPKQYGRYFEPFVGGGALFFSLRPAKACLSDTNEELINCYRVVQKKVGELIDSLSVHHYEKEYFYRVRNMDRLPEFGSLTDVARASRMIYLNKTCFNGLYRVNSKGYFNVPFGRYKNPKIVDAENLQACSQALRNAAICVKSFVEVDREVRKGDFVYFDPPYVPLSDTAYFTGYTEGGFDHSAQVELAALCKRLDRKGVFFMLSNSHTPVTVDLYRTFRCSKVVANRAINSKATRRSGACEIIVTNY